MPRINRPLPRFARGGPSSKMTRAWGFRRKSLLDLYEYYGTVIRSRGVLNDEELLAYMEEKTARTPHLQRTSTKAQLAGVKFLCYNELDTFDKAVASGLVKLVDPKKGQDGKYRIGDHHREFWDQALGKYRMDETLLELLRDLNEKPAVRMLMAHRPTPLWGRKPHWKSDYNYPKKAEYYIFTQALELLAESCFEFVNKYEPEYQHRRRIECAESFELTVWLDYIREELVEGNISYRNLRGGARLKDFERVANQVRLLRNDTFHQGLRTSEFLSKNLTHGIELARMLGDEHRTRQLESMREDLDKGSLFVEYLQSRLATEQERDIEMGILERVIIVLLQRLRDSRDEYQLYVVALRTQYKNEYGIAQREKMLKIRGQIQLETSTQKAEGALSFEKWQEERERSARRNEAETPQSDAVRDNQHEQKSSKPPADSHPFEHSPRMSGQPLGLRKSWLSPDADIESKELDVPKTAEAESTTSYPDEVSPSGSAAETTEKHWVPAESTKKQGDHIWNPKAVSEDLDDANISNNRNSPDAPTPQHTKSSPAPPAIADSKKKSAPAAPTAAATAAGKESKDAKQAAPPTNDEVLDFTEVDGYQTTSSSHRLK